MTDTDFTSTPTGAGLIGFLDWAIVKGHLKRATGQAMKTAVREVLVSTEGEDAWETVNVDELDVDGTLQRFETLRAMKFSTGSLATYQGRFRRAVDMYASFRESPATFRPSVRSRNRGPATPPSGPRAASDSSAAAAASPTRPSDPSAAGHRGPSITYPFPLRANALAEVTLPPDLTTREADRLVAFIKSLAIDDDPTEQGG